MGLRGFVVLTLLCALAESSFAFTTPISFGSRNPGSVSRNVLSRKGLVMTATQPTNTARSAFISYKTIDVQTTKGSIANAFPSPAALHNISNCIEQIFCSCTTGISITDITPQIKQILSDSKIQEGFVNVISRHTTTGYDLSRDLGIRS